MKRAVLFDLGNTLVQYFDWDQYDAFIERTVGQVRDYLHERDLLCVSPRAAWQAVAEQNLEAGDHRVRPLEGRLAAIFQLTDGAGSRDLMHALCRCFLRPVFDTAHLYPDTIPVLEELRGRGYRLGIVSNTFWGSPADLWHAEAARHGLDRLVDEVVFCTDVGWRKPAPQIFYYTVEKLGVRPEDCLFVGDDLRWDVQGPRAVGMQALLLDRGGKHAVDGPVLRTLYEVCGALGR